MNIEKIFWKVFKYFFIGLFAIIVFLMIFWDGDDKVDAENGYYSLLKSTTLSSNHPSYKAGYRYSCLYKHTDPNTNLKYIDEYSKQKCPKTTR